MIPNIYDRINNFKNGVVPVCIGDKWGYIDTEGKTVIPFQYDYVSGYSEGLSNVLKISKTGSAPMKEAVPQKEKEVIAYSENLGITIAGSGT